MYVHVALCVHVVVWCCGVWCGAAWHAEKPSVCRFKTSPCVRSKRHRVCRQHAHMLFSMWTWCRYTRGRFEPAHGEEGGIVLFSLCLSLQPSLPLFLSSLLSFSLSLPSFFFLRLHLSLFSFSFSSLFSFSLSSFLSVTMTMITRPVGSLCVHTVSTCESVGVRVLRSIPCLANKLTLYARNNCPSITVQASCHLERSGPVSVLGMGVVFVLCLSMMSWLCCWLRRCWRRCVGCCVVVKVQKIKKRRL